MKYLCPVYGEEKLMQTMDDNECAANGEKIRKNGHHVAAEALQPVDTATTVQVREGKVSVTDGPFAETKEQLGGYYLIEAKDMDEAVEIASKIPGGRFGCVEVRPVAEDQQTKTLGF